MTALDLVVVVDDDDADCAQVFVDGEIAGRPYRFLLDTGAGRSQVVADEFLLTFAQEGRHSSRGAFGGQRESSLVKLPDVTVGPLRATSLLASIVPGDEPGASNLIGMDVLRSYCCEFRFSTAELHVGEAATDTPWTPLHMDAVGHPYLQIGWPDVRAEAVWDTGAGITVVDTSFYEKWPALFTSAGTSSGTDVNGDQVAAQLAMVAMPPLGGVVLRPHKVAVVDLAPVNATLDRPMDLILGFTTLCQADWLFDFPSSRWSASVTP